MMDWETVATRMRMMRCRFRIDRVDICVNSDNVPDDALRASISQHCTATRHTAMWNAVSPDE